MLVFVKIQDFERNGIDYSRDPELRKTRDRRILASSIAVVSGLMLGPNAVFFTMFGVLFHLMLFPPGKRNSK